MARAVIGIGGVAWSVLCVATAVVAVGGVEWLVELLPPLQVDTEAVRGAVIAGGIGIALAAGAHLAVLVGLRTRRRPAWSAGILLTSLASAIFVALAAAAFTSAVSGSAPLTPMAVAGVLAGLIALAYGLATARLVGELRSGEGG